MLKMSALNVLYVTLCFASVFAVKLPSYINPCSSSDPNLDQCIEEVIRTGAPLFAKGIPELDIPSLDPVNVGTVVINNPSLNLTMTDTVITGLGGLRLNSYHINLDKGKATIDFTANVTLKAHYIMDGQVLILPIKGDGDAKFKLRNLNIVVKYDFNTVNGYWTIPEYTESYKMEHVHYKLTNLFGGNKELADVTLQFLNDNWSDIIYEIAPPALHQIIKHCVDNIRNFFSKIPVSEMLLQ